MTNKVGWHKNGTGGRAAGLSDQLLRLDALRIPFCLNAPDDAGLIAWAATLNGASHQLVFRKTWWSPAPDYHLSPEAAALARWQSIMGDMPSEIAAVKHRVWIEPTNEPDRERADWVGRFMVAIAVLANADGYRIAGPSWSTGNPEYDHWATEGMRLWIKYTLDHPQQAIQTLHEYSLDAGDMRTGSPWLVGRYEITLFAVCDEFGLGRPNVLVTELGWTLNDMPDLAPAMTQIEWAMDLYGRHSQIKGVCLWTLGSGSQWGTLPAQLEPLIVPVTDLIVAKHADDPPTDGVRVPARIKHTIHLLPQDTTELELDLVTQHLHPTRSTFAYSHDVVEAVMYHSTPDGTIVAWDPERWDLDLRQRFAWLGVRYREDHFQRLIDPLFDLRLAAPFRIPFALTSSFNAPRNYANGRHEGADYDVLGGPAESLEPVLAVVAGTVVQSQFRSDGYGHTVVVEFQHNGRTLRVWYCHMDSRLVKLGDTVKVGQPMGEVGSTGGNFAEHVHINLQLLGGGLSGYYVPDVIDPAPYISMTPQPVAGLHDMADFFSPSGGRTAGDIVILSNNWGQGDERQQLHRHGSDAYVVKNAQWEKRVIGENAIRFEVDTSPGNNEFYLVNSATGWMPRHWSPGSDFFRSEVAIFYNKDTCVETKRFASNSTLRFVRFHDRFTTRGGLVLNNVAEVQWIRNGAVEETYWYARGLGLVQWENRHGFKSQATEFIPRGQQADNVRETIRCLS